MLNKKIYIGKNLLKKIINNESVLDIATINLEEGFFIMDETEGCVELSYSL